MQHPPDQCNSRACNISHRTQQYTITRELPQTDKRTRHQATFQHKRRCLVVLYVKTYDYLFLLTGRTLSTFPALYYGPTPKSISLGGSTNRILALDPIYLNESVWVPEFHLLAADMSTRLTQGWDTVALTAHVHLTESSALDEPTAGHTVGLTV